MQIKTFDMQIKTFDMQIKTFDMQIKIRFIVDHANVLGAQSHRKHLDS